MILDQYKLVIFDADGTLRNCTVEGQFYPHSIDGACDCRKPAAGMLNKIIQHFGVAASETVFIGDSPRDKSLLKTQVVIFFGFMRLLDNKTDSCKLWHHDTTFYRN